MSNFRYTKHLRFPGAAFFKETAPSIVSSANADADTITELALMGAHCHKPCGVQLVVQRKELEDFLRYRPSIPYEELAWPSRTIELYLDHPLIPTILAGCFSSEDFERMGFKGVEGRDTATHLLIQENAAPVSIQAFYSAKEMEDMMSMKPSDMSCLSEESSGTDNVIMGLSATFIYRALDLFNKSKFVKYATLRESIWQNTARNRPSGLSLMLATEFNQEEEQDVS